MHICNQKPISANLIKVCYYENVTCWSSDNTVVVMCPASVCLAQFHNLLELSECKNVSLILT